MIASALLAFALAADPAPPNAVQREMALLQQAVIATVMAIANGNTAPVPEAFHEVHAAKAATAAALTAGQWKPKAGTTVAAFVKEDEAFHRELERLVKAAAKNDVVGTARQLGAVLNGCPACHTKFRPDPEKPR